jgi:putative restriction endonuclease
VSDGIPDGITREDVSRAIADFDVGVAHDFAASTGYDLVIEGRRYPPKAIIGLAARRIAGRNLTPYDFKGGEGSRCFRILRDLGFDVQPKPGITIGFAVITENDESKWHDETGVRYHFPKRYFKFLSPGTRVIYYKGKLQDNVYAARRLSAAPHYFGLATIGKVFPDPESQKGDFYATIEDFYQFSKPVLAKTAAGFIEEIPETRITNYWRDGVRHISEDVYDQIVYAAESANAVPHKRDFAVLTTEEATLARYPEGALRSVTVNAYERNPRARADCIAHYGPTCRACEFDFAKYYGPIGAGYIHVHHVRDLASIGKEYHVDPIKDLSPVCPNCHAMLHTERPAMTIETLRTIIHTKRHRE